MLVDREGRPGAASPHSRGAMEYSPGALERDLRLALFPSSRRHFPFCLRQPSPANLSGHLNLWMLTRLIALPLLSGTCSKAGVLRERGGVILCISVVIGAPYASCLCSNPGSSSKTLVK